MDSVRKALSHKTQEALGPGIEALVAAARTLQKDANDGGALIWKQVWNELPGGKKQEILQAVAGDPRLSGFKGRMEEATLVDGVMNAPNTKPPVTAPAAVYVPEDPGLTVDGQKLAIPPERVSKLVVEQEVAVQQRDYKRVAEINNELESLRSAMREQTGSDDAFNAATENIDPNASLASMPVERPPAEPNFTRSSIKGNLTSIFDYEDIKGLRGDNRSDASRADDAQAKISDLLAKAEAAAKKGDAEKAQSLVQKAREIFVDARKNYAPQGKQIKDAQEMQRKGLVPVTPPTRPADSPLTESGRSKQLKRAEELGKDRTAAIRKLKKVISLNEKAVETARLPEVSEALAQRREYGQLPLFTDSTKRGVTEAVTEATKGMPEKRAALIAGRVAGDSTEGIPNSRLEKTGIRRNADQYMEGLRRQLMGLEDKQRIASDPRTQSYIERIRQLSGKPTALRTIDPGVSHRFDWEAMKYATGGSDQMLRLLEKAVQDTRSGMDVMATRRAAESGGLSNMDADSDSSGVAIAQLAQARVGDLDLDTLLPKLPGMDAPLWDALMEFDTPAGTVRRKLTPQEIVPLLLDRAEVTSPEAQRKWRAVLEPIVAANVARKRSGAAMGPATRLTEQGALEPIKGLPAPLSSLPDQPTGTSTDPARIPVAQSTWPSGTLSQEAVQPPVPASQNIAGEMTAPDPVTARRAYQEQLAAYDTARSQPGYFKTDKSLILALRDGKPVTIDASGQPVAVAPAPPRIGQQDFSQPASPMFGKQGDMDQDQFRQLLEALAQESPDAPAPTDVVDAVSVEPVPQAPVQPINTTTDTEDMGRRPKVVPSIDPQAAAVARVRSLVDSRKGGELIPVRPVWRKNAKGWVGPDGQFIAEGAGSATAPTGAAVAAPAPQAAAATTVSAPAGVPPELAPYLARVQADTAAAAAQLQAVRNPTVESRAPVVPATPSVLEDPAASATAAAAPSPAAQVVENAPIGQQIAAMTVPPAEAVEAAVQPATNLPIPSMLVNMQGATGQMPGVDLNLGQLPPPAPPRTPPIEMPPGFEAALDPSMVQTPELTPSPVQPSGVGYVGAPPSAPPGGPPGGPPNDPNPPENTPSIPLMRRLGNYTRKFGAGFVDPEQRMLSNDVAALIGSIGAGLSMSGEEDPTPAEIDARLKSLAPANPAAPPSPSLGPSQPAIDNRSFQRPEDTVRRLLNTRHRSQPSAMQQLLR